MLNLNQAPYNYIIKAYEGIGSQSAISWSNIIYLFQKPILYVPNVFTPNFDGNNDFLNYLPAFAKDLHFKIFNRWGEFVWETYSKYERWDGVYRGNIPFNNVYIWQAELTGYDESIHFYNGNFTILK
jgi:gliding motility-associated-like protein